MPQPDPRNHDRVAQHLTVEELEGGGHLQVIPGAAADQRDPRTGHRVGTADNLLLVARQTVRQQHQDVERRRSDVVQHGGCIGAGVARRSAESGRASR